MKFNSLIASSVVFFSAISAQAVLQAPGTFVPAQCGAQTQVQIEGGSIGEVCIGSIVGEETRAVEFRMMDEPNRLFRVTNQSTIGIGRDQGTVMAMMTLTSEAGEETEMKVLSTPEGEITAVSGQLGYVDYTVTEFATIFSIQSL